MNAKRVKKPAKYNPGNVYELSLEAGIGDRVWNMRLWAANDDDAIAASVDILEYSAFARVAYEAFLYKGERLVRKFKMSFTAREVKIS